MPLVPAVAYIRRSSDSQSQETSLADQTRAIDQFASEKGYRILRWYSDDAVSGDDTEKRHEFLRMIADAPRGEFETILCWDRARFGRFDSIEAGYYLFPLRKVGVKLVTVMDGLIDWNDPMQRMFNGMQQEGKHQQLLDHSANVRRGQLEAAKIGSWVGSPPFGYRIEGGKKNKRLVVDDPTKVKVIQRIFREFVDDGRSMSEIAKRLQAEGFPAPGNRGRPWRFDAVRVILENPAYTGDFASNRQSYGKYHIVRGERVTKGKAAGGRVRNPESQWIVRRDHHEAIVDRERFEKAQTILARGKTGRGPFKSEDNPFVLNSLLRCGKCGGPMWGDRNQTKSGPSLTYE